MALSGKDKPNPFFQTPFSIAEMMQKARMEMPKIIVLKDKLPEEFFFVPRVENNQPMRVSGTLTTAITVPAVEFENFRETVRMLQASIVVQNRFPTPNVFETLWQTKYCEYHGRVSNSQHPENKAGRVTTLYAKSYSEAEQLCKKRGLGEILIGNVEPYQAMIPVLTSTHLQNQRWGQAAHACTWLCMLAVASKTRDAMELLTDNGLLHETMHAVEAGCKGSLGLDGGVATLIQRTIDLEREVPGMWPVFSADDPMTHMRESLRYFNPTEVA